MRPSLIAICGPIGDGRRQIWGVIMKAQRELRPVAHRGAAPSDLPFTMERDRQPLKTKGVVRICCGAGYSFDVVH
jgi:hypothetical protein